MFNKALELHKKVSTNHELLSFEQDGFARGERKGKSMNIPLRTLFISLQKQNLDLIETYLKLDKLDEERTQEMKRCLADIRNVAGCCFLKINE